MSIFGMIQGLPAKVLPEVGEMLIGAVIGSNLTKKLLNKMGVKPDEDGRIEIKDGGLNNPSDEVAFALAITKVKGTPEWKTGGKMVLEAIESLPAKKKQFVRVCIGFLTNFAVVKKTTKKTTKTPKAPKPPKGTPPPPPEPETTTEVTSHEKMDPSVEFLKYLASQGSKAEVVQVLKANGFLEKPPEDKISEALKALDKNTAEMNQKPYKGFFKTLFRI